MATRRNVPSKDVFRAIRGGFNKAFEGSPDLVLNTRPHPDRCFQDSTLYLSTRSSHQIRPLCSAIHRQGSFSPLYSSTTTRGTHPRYESSVRSISTSKKSSAATPAERPAHADVPLHLEDLESTHSAYAFFPLSSTTNTSVSEQNQTEKKDDLEYHPWKTANERNGIKSRTWKREEEEDAIEIQPRDSEEETANVILEDDIPTIDMEAESEDVTLSLPPYIAPGMEVPYNVLRRIGRYTRTICHINDPRHEYLYRHVLLIRDRHDDGAALRAAGEILRCYINTKLEQDWELSKQLYISLCYRFMSAKLRSIRNSLVRAMLAESPPRLEAVSLLVKKIESDRDTTLRHILSYLGEFCDEQPDFDLQLAEVDKILQSVGEFPECRTTQILVPLVRSAIIANDPDHARDLTSRLSQTYELTINFIVPSEIIKGYARQGNMSAIDELLAELHSQGFSRSKPYEFAALVRTVFQFLIPMRRPGNLFDFLTYAIGNHGLIPTTTLSISVMKYFAASRRYDLMQKWVSVQQASFPNILSPVSTPLAAYEINDAWTHMVASPLDTLSTCKAMAYGALRNPFTEDFRYMTNNWLSSSLYKLFKQLMQQAGIDQQRIGFKRSSNLDSIFEASDRLIRFIPHWKSDTRVSILVNTFRKKVEAAKETEFLVNRFSEYVQQHGPILEPGEQVFSDQKFVKKQPSTSLLPRRIQRMSGHKLARAIIETYGIMDSNGDRDQRHMVIDMVRHLQYVQRRRDCAILLRQLWYLGCVNGQFFTHEIIKGWVKIAYELREPKMLHEALWAAIDSEPSHVIGYKFLMLIRVAVSVIVEDVDAGRKQQYPNQLEELKYLISRCYRRRWQQDGCPNTEEIADPWLKRWKEEQDKPKDLLQIVYNYVL